MFSNIFQLKTKIFYIFLVVDMMIPKTDKLNLTLDILESAIKFTGK